MTRWLILLAVAAVVALLVWRGRARPLFVLVFQDGRLVRARGKIPQGLRGAFEEVARTSGLSGEVRLLPGDELRCSGTIAPARQQQLRNAYFAWR